ncbi:hypothetical protein L596_004246 [Steinernema carpocapsae]|uniref:Uncharacterized protein n=1 Tax=Steinernema carpocapsae TaxID=34508 RepID=A0A4U8UWU5_STECR|nr:hypothetical protein L596_004246 [Steinernema carpocapsae]
MKKKGSKADHPSTPQPSANRFDGDQKKRRPSVLRGRSVQIDDVLWVVCFLMTCWFFNIPTTLWFHRSVDWQFLTGSFSLLALFFALSLYIFWKSKNGTWRAWAQSPVLFVFCLILLLVSVAMFCLATWKVWNAWSLYVVFVTTMTVNAMAAISL